MDTSTKTRRRAIVMQKKTRPQVRLEITAQAHDALANCIATVQLKPQQFLFLSRVSESPHPSTQQYSRIVGVLGWVDWYWPGGYRNASGEPRLVSQPCDSCVQACDFLTKTLNRESPHLLSPRGP